MLALKMADARRALQRARGRPPQGARTPVAFWCFIALAHDSSSSSSMPSAERRYVQKEARSSLGGVATPACRWKQDLTSCVHAELL